MMFKRVSLLLLLVAVLVVPGAAIGFRDDFDGSPSGLWSHYVSGGHDKTSGGVLKTGTIAGTLTQRWNWYVYSPGIDVPFEYTIRYNIVDGFPGQYHVSLLSSDSNMRYSDFGPEVYRAVTSSLGFGWHTITYRVLEDGEVYCITDGVSTLVTSSNSRSTFYPCFGTQLWHRERQEVHIDYVSIRTYDPYVEGEPVTVRVVDADSREPLDDLNWHLNILDGRPSVDPDDKMIVNTDVIGTAEKLVYLPKTGILNAHWLSVTADGYEQYPSATLLFDVPTGGRTVTVHLKNVEAPADEGNVWLSFEVTDAETGYHVPGAMVNLDGNAVYVGASGIARFEVPVNSSHKWVASSSRHWPMGGDITVDDVDVLVPVVLVPKESDLPRPPLPEMPNFPVLHPFIDPGVLRSHILDVPLLGPVAAPFLDFIDDLIHGVDEVVDPVLDFVAGPLRDISSSMGSVGGQIQESVTGYAATSAVLLGAVGTLLSAFPDLVLGLVSYGLLLDLVYLLLRGGM